MKIKANTIPEYFEALRPERRECLLQLRSMIKRTWPQIKEDLAYGMPTYHLDGETFCAIGDQKHYMAFYVMPYDLLNAFVKDLKAYDTGRSCIRFRKLEPHTVELFDRIIKYTGMKYPDSSFYGKVRLKKSETEKV